MANEEHLEFLKQGVEQWNLWRKNNLEVEVDLRGAYLYDVDLEYADLRGVYLSKANLNGAYLDKADLRDADLTGTELIEAELIEVNLRDADLRGANLYRANLYRANLRGVNLYGADLRGTNLAATDLRDANLSGLDLSGVDLGYARLNKAQVLGARFEKSVLTGACLEDWNINSATRFDGVICEYVFLKGTWKERRPREGIFKPGEFAALFQQAVDTVDLIFKDGIDWQAFFRSFRDLRSQYADQDLSIQAIEKKQGGTFVVRVEVAEGADKQAIEGDAKQLYEAQLQAIEAQYEKQLRLQGAHLEDIQSILKVEREERTRLSKVVEKLADGQRAPKYDLSNAQFAGGFAETVQGSQYGGTINHHHGPNTDDITRLLNPLRDQAQTFPTDQKDEALDTLEALQDDLAKPNPDQPRIGRRLKKLVTLDATTSGDLTDLTTFTNKVIELTETLGIPAEQVQLPSSGNS